MSQNYYVDPPAKLGHRVLRAVRREEQRRAKRLAALYSGGAVISLAGSSRLALWLYQSLAESGFYHYFSLLFSGDRAILSAWQELSLSLAESLPLVTAMVFCGVLACFVWSSVRAVANASRLILIA